MFNNDYIKEAFIKMRNTLAISHTLKAINLELVPVVDPTQEPNLEILEKTVILPRRYVIN